MTGCGTYLPLKSGFRTPALERRLPFHSNKIKTALLSAVWKTFPGKWFLRPTAMGEMQSKIFLRINQALLLSSGRLIFHDSVELTASLVCF